MKAWIFEHPGEPADALALRDVDEPVPGPGELLIDVHFAGLAFPDVLRVRGNYQIVQPPGSAPGQEWSGTVVGAGEGTTTAVGAHVFGVSQIGHGALAERVIALELDLAPVPAGVTGEAAAALPGNYGTADIALHRRGAVRAGDHVVIAGAAGGVGSAAVQLAKAAGCRVMGIDAGADRAAFCLEIGADAAADSRRDDLVAAIEDFTEGRGFDVMIDMVGGEVFDAGRRAVASEGRIVIVGFTSGTIPEVAVNRLLLRNFSIVGMNAFHYQTEMNVSYRRVAALCASGELEPLIDGIYPFQDAPDVLQRIAAGLVRGKAVVTVAGRPEGRPED